MTEETADETEAVDSKRPDIMRRHVVVGWLIASNLLLPLGFICGGLYFYGGDPGLGAVILVPAGAMFLFLGTLLAVLDVTMYRQKD